MFKGKVIFYENKGDKIKMRKRKFNSLKACNKFIKTIQGPLFIEDLDVSEFPFKLIRKVSKKLENKLINLLFDKD